MSEMKSRPWDACFAAKKERLSAPDSWFPYPLLLSFVFVLQFTAHTVFSTSARIGSPAEVIEFPGEESHVNTLWFAVTPVGDEIMVTTEDRKVFHWKQNVRSLESLSEFREFLKKKAKQTVFSSTLSKDALRKNTKAIIAADQRLKFLHLRPILYALAEAKIVQYGFETKIPQVAVNSDHLNQDKFH
jgi:hypothetical protein